MESIREPGGCRAAAASLPGRSGNEPSFPRREGRTGGTYQSVRSAVFTELPGSGQTCPIFVLCVRKVTCRSSVCLSSPQASVWNRNATTCFDPVHDQLALQVHSAPIGLLITLVKFCVLVVACFCSTRVELAFLAPPVHHK